MIMDVRIIKKKDRIEDLIFKGEKILEVYLPTESGANLYDLSLYNPDKNTVTDIVPDIEKQMFLPVNNCLWESTVSFYVSCVHDNAGIHIDFYRHNLEAGAPERILTIDGDELIIQRKKHLRIFALAENQLLVQTEMRSDDTLDESTGNIMFSANLYNTDTGQCALVSDSNLTSNGINSVIPVSSNSIMVKTGFSFLEDDRLKMNTESDALVENVYYGTMSGFISGLQIGNAFSGFRILATAFFDKFIASPIVRGDYIIFSIYDPKDMKAESVFYNSEIDEVVRCMNEGVEKNDLPLAFLIDNKPYVRTRVDERTIFYNVAGDENDYVFFDETFEDVQGKLFIFHRKRGRRNFVRIYKAPRLELIHEEKGYYNMGISKDEKYYIYVKDTPREC